MKLTSVALASALCLTAPLTFAQTSTGQGIMVNLIAPSAVTLQQTQTYAFNEITASAYYNNVHTSSTCTSGTCPSPLPAPLAPDATQVSKRGAGQAFEDRCIFLDGGPLRSKTYTQKTQVTGKGGYTVTHNYQISPNVGQVAALTAWDLVSSQGRTTAQIPVTAEIAGLSAQQRKGESGPKYSFSIENYDSLTASYVSRVAGLSLKLNGSEVATPGHSVQNNSSTAPVDFFYTTNAGMNGTTSLLANGDARTLLNNDIFKGNDNGGSDGRALAKVNVAATNLELGEGNYTISLTGTVKGNSASASIGFDVAVSTQVIGKSCGVAQ